MIEFSYKGKISFIPYNNISLYLENSGWDLKKEKGLSKVYCNQLNQEFDVTAVLPDKKSHRLNNSLFQLFDTLANFEDCTLESILESIINIDKDIWKMSFSKGSKISSMDLADVDTILKNIKNLISYSGSAEQEPKSYFERPLAAGNLFVADCKFGHTYAGSFGFTIITPIVDSARPTLETGLHDALSIPIGRRINERIIKCLEMVVNEVEISNDIINVYENSMNANICTALKNLLKASSGDLQCSIQPSPLHILSDELKTYSKVILKHSNLPYLENVYNILYQEYELIRDITVKGSIIELKCENNSEDDSDYNIVIIGDFGNKNNEKVHINLNENDYLKACEYHKDGIEHKDKNIVHIFGNIRRTKNKWYLDSYSNFQEITDIRADNALNDVNQEQMSKFR